MLRGHPKAGRCYINDSNLMPALKAVSTGSPLGQAIARFLVDRDGYVAGSTTTVMPEPGDLGEHTVFTLGQVM